MNMNKKNRLKFFTPVLTLAVVLLIGYLVDLGVYRELILFPLVVLIMLVYSQQILYIFFLMPFIKLFELITKTKISHEK
jgi:hypothetical protein